MNRWVGCFVEWLFGMLVGGLVGGWVLVIQSVRWLPNWWVGSLVGWLVVWLFFGWLVNGLIGIWFGGSVTWWDGESSRW